MGVNNIIIRDEGSKIIIRDVGSFELNSVDVDTPFRFDGTSGDTYLKYNSTTSRLELYVDGVKQVEWG